MTLPSFPFTEVKAVTGWSNFHGTIHDRPIPIFCTPGTSGGTSLDDALAQHAAAVNAIVTHCFGASATLRVLGSAWSLSSVVRPGAVAIDPGHLNRVVRLPDALVTDDFRTRRAGFAAFYAEGGTRIAQLNQQLAPLGFALQTSGASDGHRVAGCVATGTHGSALHVGAVHDTLLGVHLLVSPGHAKLVVPATHAAVSSALAAWLEKKTHLATELVANDDAYGAALVCLGSLGVVLGVVVEAAPLYRLHRRVLAHARRDPKLWEAVRTSDASAFHPDVHAAPHHFQVTFNPFANPDEEGAFITLMWKEPVGSLSPDEPIVLPPEPQKSSDTMELLGGITDLLDGPISAPILRSVLAKMIRERMPTGDFAPLLPGSVFGPISLPPGFGASTEIVVARDWAFDALRLVFATIDAESRQGRHFTGLVSARFVGKTKSLLGMNVHDVSCHIELPGVRNHEISGIFQACYRALDGAKVPFTCHWGQLQSPDATRLRDYYGNRLDRWKAARDALLSAPGAKKVFSSDLLHEVGLD